MAGKVVDQTGTLALLAAKFHGRAGQLAGRSERAGLGIVFAGSNPDGRLDAPLGIRIGVLD